MTWGYDEVVSPFAWQQSQSGTPIQTLYGPPSMGWEVAGDIQDLNPGLGQAPAGAAIVWENRPVYKGLYWMEAKLPKPLPMSKMQEMYNDNKPPWSSEMYPLACGAFTKIQGGKQVMVWGPEIDQHYENQTFVFGDQEGEYQFNNAFYAWGTRPTMPGTEAYVESLFFYGIMLEDADTGGLDPDAGPIDTYYNAKGQVLYEVDGHGNRDTPGQTLSGLPAVFLWGFVAFLLTYFGFFGKTAQKISGRIATTLIKRGVQALGRMVSKLTEALKTGAGKAAAALGSGLVSVMPWLIGITVGTAILWNLASDSGGTR